MSKKDLLISLLKEAVNKCYDADRPLIDRSMEQASVARIFYYMQRAIDTDDRFEQFREYNLDCEYNKNMDDCKRLAEEEAGKRPDMILHRRLSNEGNLLILEFKSANSRQSVFRDCDKLKRFTAQSSIYKYFLGISVKLNLQEADYKYCQDGQEKEERELRDE